MVQRARRRKANGTSLDRLADVACHLSDVVGRGVLVVGAALTHHVDAQRGVRQEGGDVHRVLAPAERVEVLGEGLPLPLDPLVQRRAGDVLDALHQLDEPRLLARAAPGAKPTPQLPATTVVTPWEADGSSTGSQVA